LVQIYLKVYIGIIKSNLYLIYRGGVKLSRWKARKKEAFILTFISISGLSQKIGGAMRTRIFALLILVVPVLAGIGCVHSPKIERNALPFFSSDYYEARNKFLRASREAGAQIENYKIPNPGPDGKPIFTDVSFFGRMDAKNILILGSGTHGVEGFAGSGIQTGLLREGFVTELKPDVGLVMIHAINPYGFAQLRRFNEDNVDLNRNFVDHSQDYPKNDGYKKIADAVLPKTLSFWENTKSRLKLLWFRLTKGKNCLKHAISSGQYSYPQGLFYRGSSEAWSNKTLRKIIKLHSSKAERVIFIGFHTGLGAFGNAEVILNVKKDTDAYENAVKLWGDRVKTTVGGGSVSGHLQGTVKLAVPNMVPNPVETVAVSLEFGTYSPRKVFWALRAENWLHHHGNFNHQNAKEIKDNLLRAFYPKEDKWKSQVWKHGKEVVEQALVYFK
jgi:hypothetical protein